MNTTKKLISFVLATVILLSGCDSQESYNYEKLSFEGIEETDFKCLVEAEESPRATVKTDKTGYSGSGYIDIVDNRTFKLSVDIPSSQYYKITVRHCADDHKENPLLFNGAKVMDIYSEAGDWAETTVNGIFLEKGSNKITLGEGWSWFSIDSILIENGEPLSDEIYENVTRELCNPNANKKTKKIYRYLMEIYGKRTLSGQCTDYGHNTETDALYLGLGKYPAVRTFDFIYDSMNFCHNNPSAKDVELAIDWSKEGGLVAFDWHWYAPYGKCEFYSEKTDFRLSNAVTDNNLAQLDLVEIEKMYNEGKISVEAFKIVEDIDNISSLMKRMEKENVTVMWRPLHEASGGWFWWGESGAESYKWLWKLMYERMTDYHKLNNLIWVWNGQDKYWYPGDEYCDIAAIDIYSNAHDHGTSPATLENITDWTGGKKLVTMSECATMPDPDLIVRDNAYWLWFAVWNWDYIVVNGTTELSEAYTSLEMMKKVYDSEAVITRDELPKF
ncbi:MAG: hypothetical protein K2K41_02080 [Ruminiclostridium sp.]|nr:hypothetical protein [Ruminiclostridium sp.]